MVAYGWGGAGFTFAYVFVENVLDGVRESVIDEVSVLFLFPFFSFFFLPVYCRRECEFVQVAGYPLCLSFAFVVTMALVWCAVDEHCVAR